jgi:hypothetical protein
MKKFFGGFAVLALSAALLPAAFAQQDQTAQPSSEQPSAQQPSAQQPSTSQPASPAQDSATPATQASSFHGTVVNAGGKYVLKTDTMTYQIDDQDKAKAYENKQVMVSGTVDQSTSTLHITDIAPMSQQ